MKKPMLFYNLSLSDMSDEMSKILNDSGIEHHIIFFEKDTKPFLIQERCAYPLVGIEGATFLTARFR